MVKGWVAMNATIDNTSSTRVDDWLYKPPLGILISRVNWLNAFVIFLVPLAGILGGWYTPLHTKTLVFCVFYYSLTALGVTAGYHRLWSHRAYNASPTLQYFLAFLGAGAVQGSIYWFARQHRAHHRYVDTDQDPHNARQGLFHTHLGWLLFKRTTKLGYADMSDLKNNGIVMWQHQYYIPLFLFSAFAFPSLVSWYFWDDPFGGLVYAGILRLFLLHHSTFSVNSLAHYLGSAPFDDKHTPRDHFVVALLTMGEGYHNFHHQFPNDYRNAIRWYQYDPTKCFIWLMRVCGLATHLKVFSDNEVRKGQLTMKLKALKATQDGLEWPLDPSELPVITWETSQHSYVVAVQQESADRSLVLIAGFIHDVTSFIAEHPGGPQLLSSHIGKDGTSAFFGGVYNHSNAAHNLLAMKRVGVLEGGIEVVGEHDVVDPALKQRLSYMPPSQRLRVVRFGEEDDVA